jgi:protocatechuate 3,4-dioxygenase beta subunit
MNRQKFILTLTVACASALTLVKKVIAQYPQRVVGGGCDGCDLIYEGMPRQFSNTAYLPDWHEAGHKMIVEGTVYKKDKRTPAKNVIVYLYHTDSKGYYSKAPGQVNGLRHEHIRGWIRTGADGKYRFYTTMPAPYPGKNSPAHIHPVIKEAGINEYYIDDYWFEGDVLITPDLRKKAENRGGNGIIKLMQNNQGWQVCKRDIILGLNIPDYV